MENTENKWQRGGFTNWKMIVLDGRVFKDSKGFPVEKRQQFYEKGRPSRDFK